MDTRNGDLYVTKEAGLAAGVPEESLAEVAVRLSKSRAQAMRGLDPEVLTIASGPFKGRQYRREPDGRLVRVDGVTNKRRR